MTVELRAEHFTADDHDLLLLAGNRLVIWAQDVAHHEWDGMGWWRTAAEDPAETVDHLADLIEQTEQTLSEVRHWRTEALRPVRARAINQQRRQAREARS